VGGGIAGNDLVAPTGAFTKLPYCRHEHRDSLASSTPHRQRGTPIVPGEPVFNVYEPVESAEVITIGERRMIRFGRTGVFGSFLKMMMRRKTRETLEWLERLKAI
jgi:hypothetical protein